MAARYSGSKIKSALLVNIGAAHTIKIAVNKGCRTWQQLRHFSAQQEFEDFLDKFAGTVNLAERIHT